MVSRQRALEGSANSARIVQFCCAVASLGILTYFLGLLVDEGVPVNPTWLSLESAVGAASLYTLLALLSTLCLIGCTRFAILVIILDIVFTAVFAMVAWLTRQGINGCRGHIQTPLGEPLFGGSGPAGQGVSTAGDQSANSTLPLTRTTARRLNQFVFAAALAEVLLFMVTATCQALVIRRTQRRKHCRLRPVEDTCADSPGHVPFWTPITHPARPMMAMPSPFGSLVTQTGNHSALTNAYVPDLKLLLDCHVNVRQLPGMAEESDHRG